jgi:hypothetical protein
MSHKIHKDSAARQQAYRDREAAKRRAIRLSEIHRFGAHVQRDGKQYLVKGCPLCTVTPTQISVTVPPEGIARKAAAK